MLELLTMNSTYLKHLSGDNDGLASHVALRDHHLLGDEHLASRDLNAKVATSDHDTVRLAKNVVKVLDTLLVLNLDDDLDSCTVRAKDSTDIADVLGRADERSKDHVNAILDTKLEVCLVLLAQRRQVDGSLGKVDTLTG